MLQLWQGILEVLDRVSFILGILFILWGLWGEGTGPSRGEGVRLRKTRSKIPKHQADS